jgi:hypothetical protein
VTSRNRFEPAEGGGAPPRSAFTPAERRVIHRLSTPNAVQGYLNRLDYNTEPPPGGPMQRTFRSVVATRTAHCLEAALTAAVILEQHGYPPTVMSLESEDGLDHVLFVYRTRTGWGSVARSRDPGLHGRQPVFRSLRAMAWYTNILTFKLLIVVRERNYVELYKMMRLIVGVMVLSPRSEG